ncbi:MAG TPA: hypothetical protein VMT28_03040 [Terriglobales bacterium]|jgi:hypothetical protein|nr:hypothetical protein [Terriglobales bacterium]
MIMADEIVEQMDQKPTRRFTSYEDFLKEFYPKSTEQQEAQRKTESDGDFGIELAVESLNRHAGVLRFGED